MTGVHEYEVTLYDKLQAEHQPLLDRLEQGYFDDLDVEELEAVLKDMKG